MRIILIIVWINTNYFKDRTYYKLVIWNFFELRRKVDFKNLKIKGQINGRDTLCSTRAVILSLKDNIVDSSIGIIKSENRNGKLRDHYKSGENLDFFLINFERKT